MKYSRQRDVVLKTLRENPVHPTADELYALIKPYEPAISLATVYRNLNLLAANGIIRKFGDSEGTARFDHCTHNHYHFICSKCNKVYDVPYQIAPGLAGEAAAQTGFEVQSYDILFRGICKGCQVKNNN